MAIDPVTQQHEATPRTLYVRTQRELDDALERAGDDVRVIISAGTSIIDRLAMRRGRAELYAGSVEVSGTAHVTARGHAYISARDDATVEAFEHAHVSALGYAKVWARDHATVRASQHVRIAARDFVTVEASAPVEVFHDGGDVVVTGTARTFPLALAARAMADSATQEVR